MSPLDAFGEPVWQRLTWALLHFLWQGLTVAVVPAAAFWLFRVHRARTRYALCLLAMVTMAACPLVTFAFLQDVRFVGPWPVPGGQESPEKGPKAPRFPTLSAFSTRFADCA